MKSGENNLAQFAALLRSSNFRILPKKKKRERNSERIVKKRKQVQCNERKSVLST